MPIWKAVLVCLAVGAAGGERVWCALGFWTLGQKVFHHLLVSMWTKNSHFSMVEYYGLVAGKRNMATGQAVALSVRLDLPLRSDLVSFLLSSIRDYFIVFCALLTVLIVKNMYAMRH
jgi:hypothetical protein